MLEKWKQSLQVYFDRRMLTMILLGFSSGFPFLLVFGTFNLRLKDAGVSLAAIGLFSLVKTPYSFKWLWSPLVDRIRLPLFCKLGRRRGWALFSQLLLIIAIWAMALVDPATSPLSIAIFAFLMTIASATQDIVLDAYRIESFSTREQGAGVAVFVLGYRLGSIFSGAGALFLAAVMDWENVYKIMSLGALAGILAILFSKEPHTSNQPTKNQPKPPFLVRLRSFFKSAVYEPFADFMKRPNWVLILLFVFFYRMSDAYMAPMAYPFYDDLGFNKIEIASISKIYGTLATIAGTLIGGILVNRFGIIKSLFFCGVLQGVSNLVFVVQAYAGHDTTMLIVSISIDNISGGMGTAAFVAYLSSLCSISYTATQYALLSSLMSLARDALAATSGFLVSVSDWPQFFVLTSLMAIPGLLLLWLIVNTQKFAGVKN